MRQDALAATPAVDDVEVQVVGRETGGRHAGERPKRRTAARSRAADDQHRAAHSQIDRQRRLPLLAGQVDPPDRYHRGMATRLQISGRKAGWERLPPWS